MRNPSYWLKAYCKNKGGRYAKEIKPDGTILHICHYPGKNPNLFSRKLDTQKITNPIRHTSKGWYWGSKGPFPTREKALQVMRAIFASGYKGKNPSIFGNLFGKPKGLYEQFHGNPPKLRRVRIRVPSKNERLVAIGKLTGVEYQPYGSSKRKTTRFVHRMGDTGSRILPNKPILATTSDGKQLLIINNNSNYKFGARGIVG